MEIKNDYGVNFGIKECSKCEYKLRCEECAFGSRTREQFLEIARIDGIKEVLMYMHETLKRADDSGLARKTFCEFVSKYNIKIGV